MFGVNKIMSKLESVGCFLCGAVVILTIYAIMTYFLVACATGVEHNDVFIIGITSGLPVVGLLYILLFNTTKGRK